MLYPRLHLQLQVLADRDSVVFLHILGVSGDSSPAFPVTTHRRGGNYHDTLSRGVGRVSSSVHSQLDIPVSAGSSSSHDDVRPYDSLEGIMLRVSWILLQ
jgi:hypothetical protein